MNSKNRTLRKAVKLLIKGQLTRCIQLLEPKISLFIDNADYFYLLGRSYFTAGDTENAKLYLKRGLGNDPNHEEILLMQACFAVKDRDTYKAISIWLRLENAGCRRACLRYGLDQIRRINDIEELHNFTRSPKFARLFPTLPGALRYRMMRKLWRIFLFSVLVAIVWLGYSVGTPRLQQMYQDWRQQRQQSDIISLSEVNYSDYLSFEKANSLFTFNEDELTELTRKIRKNYDLYNDNLVQRDINKIFYSNASDKVKAKFRLIESLLGSQQEIHSFKNNFDFQEVLQNPQLYQNCFIRWQGKPTNIRIDKKGNLQFTLLVGYTDGTVLDGQVLVLLHDLISVPTDLSVTVFGKVRIRDFAAQKKEEAAAGGKTAVGNDLGDEAKGMAVPATFYIEAKTLVRS